MKTTVGELKKIIKEVTVTQNFAGTLGEVQKLARELFKIPKLPPNVAMAIKNALVKDAQATGRLPTAGECRVMMEGSDEEEDVQMPFFSKTFPNTLAELESLWQLGGR